MQRWDNGILEGGPGECPGPVAWLQGGHDRGCWREHWEEGREETVSSLGEFIEHMELTMDPFWFLAQELSLLPASLRKCFFLFGLHVL